MIALWQDLRYSARTLRKNPGFTSVVVLTLALGIGATTAIFSVVNAVMLRPLPFTDPGRLVRIWESDLPRGRPTFSASEPNFLDWQAASRTFERIAALQSGSFNLVSDDGVESMRVNSVTAGFLPVLGTTPALGRNFLPDEDRRGGNNRVVIITHGFWNRRYGGDPRILDKTLTLNDQSYAIVGVLPEQFAFSTGADLFVPLAPDMASSRGDHNLLVIGRLKDGVTFEQARADMTEIARQLSDRHPESNGGWSVRLRTFYEWIVPDATRQTLVVFAAAVGFVLLIACGNVASLMLARAAARRREISIRAALGAGRGRVISQLLVESMLLAIAGGALGCGVALAVTRMLRAFAPAGTLPRLTEIGVDARVLGFALLVSLTTAVLFGLIPALQASRPNVSDTLKDAGRGGGGPARQRLRSALVVAEVALSVSLLVAAGLLIRSMWTLQNVDPGFQTHNLLTLQVNVPGSRYPTSAKRWAVFEQMLAKIAEAPAVQASAASSIVPMGGGNTSIEILVEGRPADADGIVPSADWRIISPGYFTTLGVPLRGRDFTARDTDEAPNVAIVSQDMARRYWPGVDPIGRDFLWHSATGPRFKVVGVAGDVRSLSLDVDPRPMVYLPLPGMGWNPMTLTVRTAIEPSAVVSAVRGAVRTVDAKIPISSVRTADEIVAASLGPRRFNMFLLGCFAGVALVLASVGLYSVMSYLVSQRTHDIGVRLALGALPRDVFRHVVGRGMLLAIGGSALGLAGAFWLSRSLESLLFKVKPSDPITFAGVLLLLLAVAFAACCIPARRATRVDPVTALRYE